MAENEEEFEVSKMSKALGVSKSGYYNWRKGKISQREQKNKALLAEIKRVHAESYETYGCRRIQAKLRQEGIKCSVGRVARLMRKEDIIGVTRRKRIRTTQSNPAHKVAPNVLNREFEVKKLNQVWLTDISYIPTETGWLYLAVVMDLYSRKIIGWGMLDTLETILPLKALKMAFTQRKPELNVLHHSDRGCQYTSQAYQELLRENGCQISMSRKGNCWDNAPMESFFATLKAEWLPGKSYPTKVIAKTDIFAFIEGFYNTHRLHSRLGYVSPNQFEVFYQNSLN